MKLNRTPNPLDRSARNGENDNWDIIEGEVRAIGDRVDNFVDEVSDAAFDKIVDNSKLNWKEPVNNFNSLPSNAQKGDTRMDRSTGKVYRYDGSEWKEIQQIDAGPVNEVDARLTSQLNETESYLNETKEAINQKLSLKRDIGVPIGLSDAGSDLLSAINGNTEVNVLSIPRNESVSPIKTTFFIKSSNLFNENEVLKGYGIDSSTGLPVENESLNLSYFIPVKPSTVYIRNNSPSTVRVAFYDENYNFISSVLDKPTFTTTSKTTYVRMAIVSQVDLSGFQLNEGNTLKDFEKFYEFLIPDYLMDNSIGDEKLKEIHGEKIKDKTITSEELAIILKSPNLIDKSIAIKGKGIDASNGQIVDNESTYVTDWIDITENENYVRSRGFMRVAFYDGDKNYINNTTYESFTSPANARYVRIAIPAETFNATDRVLALNKGSIVTTEEYYEKIDEKYLPKFAAAPSENKFNFVPEIPYYDYISNELPAADGTVDFDHINTKSSDVYNKYQELESGHSDYLKMTLLGNDQSDTLPIYKIELTPNTNIGDLDIKELPTIFISCGVHGDGSGGQGDGTAGDPPTHVFSMYYFIKELCENWQSSKALEYIRHNVNLVIIPIANPWGFDNKSRLNSRGVDINRNFDSEWVSGGTHGTSAFSEKETQYIRNAFNSSTNLFMSLDYHMIGGVDFIYDDKLLRYFMYKDDKDSQQIAGQTLRKLSRRWKGKYNLSSRESYGLAEFYTVGGSSMRWYYYEGGVTSLTIEGFLATQGHQEKSGSIAMTLNVEHIGEYIMNGIRYFYNK